MPAGSSEPIEIEGQEVAAHRLGKLDPIRMRMDGLPLPHARFPVPVRIVVAPDGSVTSAKLEGGFDSDEPDMPRTLFKSLKEAVTRAQAEVMALRYRPFLRKGHAVPATFEEMVLMIPADEPAAPHVDFPQIKDWQSLRMTLQRTGCFGMCPSYSIEVRGDGTVLYSGRSYVAITGAHRGSISQQPVAGILEAFRQADYFSLRDKYILGATDLPTYTTSIAFDGRSKKVEDYAGLQVGMPAAVERLEKAIDDLADSARWIKGDGATFAVLAAEKWNFKSPEAADTLARIVSYGSAEAVRDLIAAGVPTNGHDSANSSPLEIAAFRGDLQMLNAILPAGPGTDPAVLSSALSRAAAAGKLEAVRLLLHSGANADAHLFSSKPPALEPPVVAAAASGVPAIVQTILKYRPDISARGFEDRTALIAAVYSWKSDEGEPVNRLEVVRLLLAAGAEVDARDDKGNTALIKNAWNPDIALLLIQHGADVNASNNEGWTPLYNASTPELARVLLQHGANLNVRNKRGETPLEAARQYGNPGVVEILEAAQAGKLKNPRPPLVPPE
ncbi:MAG: ankyrin repeat domain-containing protein [Chlamydiota bacterium]